MSWPGREGRSWPELPCGRPPGKLERRDFHAFPRACPLTRFAAACNDAPLSLLRRPRTSCIPRTPLVPSPLSAPPQEATILHTLRERVKELGALHQTARLLQDDGRPMDDVMRSVIALLPLAWQYPEITSARIRFDSSAWESRGFGVSPWKLEARFAATDGQQGSIEVYYSLEMPPSAEGPYLAEERDLIDSLAEMLRLYCERKLAQAAQERASEQLECRVRERTAELQQANAALEAEIAARSRRDAQIADYQARLRGLASELTRAEHQERREIAVHLHDHVGQALSILKMRVAALQGNAVFCGFDRDLAEMRRLIDQIIQFTRSLTFELSPPVLYDLGLGPALEWLAEQTSNKFGFRVIARTHDPLRALPENTQVFLFTAVRELLVNAAKHARPSRVVVTASRIGHDAVIEVADDGVGFQAAAGDAALTRHAGFGLFSIGERLTNLGGNMQVASSPGAGARVTLRVPSGG